MGILFIQIVVLMNYYFLMPIQVSRLLLVLLVYEMKIGIHGVVYLDGQCKEYFNQNGMVQILIWLIDLLN